MIVGWIVCMCEHFFMCYYWKVSWVYICTYVYFLVHIINECNKKNKENQLMRHIAGTTNFARLENEEIEKNGGQHPGEYHMFQKFHTRKNGQPSDPKSKSIMEESSGRESNSNGSWRG